MSAYPAGVAEADAATARDSLMSDVARGDYPDAIGREEAWLAARLEKLTNPSGERHEQRLADG